jgi:GR25 family glycosyltransferase involved in LPS biosynthesis
MWKFFDQIYCINLNTRKDRYEKVSKLFHDYRIPVQFYHPTPHPNGLQGCFESHIHLIQKAYISGAQQVLIFEDDIAIHQFSVQALSECIEFMKTNQDWELFYLGVFPQIVHFKIYPIPQKGNIKNIKRVHSLCGHAYVVSRKYMEKIFNLKFIDVPLDYMYMENKHAYAIFPTMFVQDASKSDNNGNYLFNIDQFYFVKILFYQLVEWYALHINVPLKNIVWIGLIFYVCIIFIKTWGKTNTKTIKKIIL